MEQIKTFYRCLYSPDHFAEFNNRNFFSSNHHIPGEWLKVYETCQSIETHHLNLECVDGLYSEQARRYFIELIEQGVDLEDKSNYDDYLAGQLAGWCAFPDPESMYQWCKDCAFPDPFIVVFKGKKLGNAVEDEGVIVEVTEIVESIRLEWFLMKYIG